MAKLVDAFFMSLRLSRTLWATVVICLGCITPATSEDWPRWRGLQRNGLLKAVSGWNGSRWVDSNPTW